MKMTKLSLYFLGFLSVFFITTTQAQQYWVKEFNCNQSDVAWAMAKTPLDEIFIPGTCSWTLPTDSPWYTKLDINGAVIWQNIYNNIIGFHAFSTAITTSGTYISAGEYSNAGAIMLVDGGGNVLWAKVYPPLTKFTSVIPTSDGGYAALGVSPAGANGSIDLVKLAPDGSIMWNLMYDGPNQDIPGQVRETRIASGYFGYLIVGSTNSFGNDFDVLAIKTDPIGNIIWQWRYGLAGTNEHANTLEQTSDLGFYVLGGYTDSPSSGLRDMMLMKIDSNGNLQWVNNNKYPAPNDEQVWDLDLTSDGGYVFTGGIGMSSAAGHYIIKTDVSGGIIQWQHDYPSLDIRQIYQDSTGAYLTAGTATPTGSALSDVFGMRVDANGNIGNCSQSSTIQAVALVWAMFPSGITAQQFTIEQIVLSPSAAPSPGTVNTPCSSFEAPGVVPDGAVYVGTPLKIVKNGTNLDLSWSMPGGTCVTTDYGVYRGTLPFVSYNHASIACTTGNLTTYSTPISSGSYYFLIAAQNSTIEGLYGRDSALNPIPAAAIPCYIQIIGSCN